VRERRVTKLYVSAVLRDRGEPRALGAPLRLLPDLRSATDAVWADGERIVVLGRRSPDPAVNPSAAPVPDVTPWVVQVGGEASPAAAPVGEGRTVAAGPGGQPIYIGTASGQALLRSGATWRPLRGARLPTLPG
jgi:hypothetical protein